MDAGCDAGTVVLVASLSKRWMTACGPPTADVVALTKEVPGVRGDEGSGPYMEALAWGLGLLESGVKEDGSKVTPSDLLAEGVPGHVVYGLTLLAKEKWETIYGYYRKVDGAPDLVRVVKCCESVASLRKGLSLPDPVWKKLVTEVEGFTVALTLDMPPPYGVWLADKMEEAVAART